MSESMHDDVRAELAELVEETRRHLVWMQESGQKVVRREGSLSATGSQPAPGQFARPSFSNGTPETGPRSRPAFMDTAERAPAPVPPPRPPAVASPPQPSPPQPVVQQPRPAAVASPPPPPPRPVVREPAPMASPTAATAERAPVAPPPATVGRVVLPATPTTRAPLPEDGAKDNATALRLIRHDIGDCSRCGLAKTRNTIVYGQGDPNAEVLFLGEAPGEDEDLSGMAFVGKAGQLLTKMIEAMGYTRDEVYICNIIKCRPPGNRKPEPAEVEACRPFAERQIRAVKPKVIVALGATAAQSLLRTNESISRMRNNWHQWEGIPVMPTFHPSYLLRAPEEKKKAWDDLKAVLAKLGRQPKKPS